MKFSLVRIFEGRSTLVTSSLRGDSAKEAWEAWLIDEKRGFADLNKSYGGVYEQSLFVCAPTVEIGSDNYLSYEDVHVARVEKVTQPTWRSVDV